MIDRKKVTAIIQARMGSSRLPGKVLKHLAGKPMLGHVISRIRMAGLVDDVRVATTVDRSDDLIETYCGSENVPVYRGDVFDVLDRYYQAARLSQADIIVRITADCPLIDPGLIDDLLIAYNELCVDFAANRLPPPWKRTFPIGLDVEIVHFQALERAWKEAIIPFEREHVMPYFYDEPGRFKTLLFQHNIDYGKMRWTVDTPKDLEAVDEILSHFKGCDTYSWRDVLAFVNAHPEIEMINADIQHKSVEEIDERYQMNQMDEENG